MEYPFKMYGAGRSRLDLNRYPAGYHYQVWGSPLLWDTDREADRDMEYLHSMYPRQAQLLQRLVEEECERQDYEGSPLYDEYPDKISVLGMCRRIRERAEKEGLSAQELSAESISEKKQDASFFDQMIQVLLFQEMYRRRCRKRNCRRWF